MSYQPDPYAAQDVYAQQQQLANENPYAAQPSAYPPPPQPYGAPAYTQPGAYAQPGAYPPPQQPYGAPGAYPPPPQYGAPPQQPYGTPAYAPVYAQAGAMKVSNPWARRALYSGVVSLILSLLTLFSLLGFAGIITGTFAIVRGITALKQSAQLPGNAGRGQAIAAIAMGTLAWIFVLLSFALRGLAGS